MRLSRREFLKFAGVGLFLPGHATLAARVRVCREQTSRGDVYYILHNPDANTYVEIDPQNYFLWELMGGGHALADLAMAYYAKFDALPFDRLNRLIAHLKANDLLEGESPGGQDLRGLADLEGLPTAEFAFRLKRLADTAFQREFDWQRADEFFTAFYRRIGWAFFTRAALCHADTLKMDNDCALASRGAWLCCRGVNHFSNWRCL